MFGFLKIFWPPAYYSFVMDKITLARDIGNMKSRDRYLSVFYTWVICKLLEDFKVPKDQLSIYMREWEKNPEKVMREWEMGKFGLTDLGYEVYPEDEQIQGKSLNAPDDKK